MVSGERGARGVHGAPPRVLGARGTIGRCFRFADDDVSDPKARPAPARCDDFRLPAVYTLTTRNSSSQRVDWHHGRHRINGWEGAMFVYVGAYTEPPSGSADGIVVFRFDDGTGELHPVQTVPGVVNPSWLTLDGREQVLFAVNEEGEGRISAFA